jgi:hypothetical protein
MAIESASASVLQSGLASMQQAQASLAESGQRIANGSLVRPVEQAGETSPDAGDSVDLAAEAVDMITARQQNAAGAALVRTADEMGDTLLDLLA